MLKKLLKYDLHNAFKVVGVFYLLAIFLGILTRIFFSFDNSFILNIIGQICSGVTISMFFNIIINNLMRLWVNFRNNFYGDESYLTHTLPVTKKTLYLSKMLSALITLFTSICVIGITLFIAYYGKENIELVKNLLMPLASVYDSTVVGIIIAFIFVCFLELLNMLESGYVGIVLGHRMNNSKLGFSILFGFITYLCTQIVAVLGVFIAALFNKDIMNLFYTTTALDVPVIKFCIYLAVIIYGLNIIMLYFINNKLFGKGVNVD